VERCPSFREIGSLLVESPVKKAFLSTIRADLSCTPQIVIALCLDVFAPGAFRVPIKVIVVHFRLKGWMPVKIVGCFVTRKKYASTG